MSEPETGLEVASEVGGLAGPLDRVIQRVKAKFAAQPGSTLASPRTRRQEGVRAHYLLNKPRLTEQVPKVLMDAFRKLREGKLAWPLFLYGGVGTGKTCGALWLLDRTGGFYFTTGSLSSDLISAYQGHLETAQEHRKVTPAALWEEIGSTALVVLDELGARSGVSEHQYDAVKRVLDEREGRPLICISNLPVESLEAIYDDRVASRLVAGTLVHLDGPDRRLRQA